ncbi:hypothetical protein [Microbacterium sp. GCS4]|uniref:hypothetical protein n=1 Tax=Microbacterium sp. GCS4 TaxID=1692239 RepID=UPI000682060F|nr:hypothetical protein [Microbacterium sp. GCS4]KNY07343.1 membrane protein [Microbacterium sp. GCS4]
MSPNPVSSTPILRRTLIWSVVSTVVLAVGAATVGYLVAQGEGLVSGLLGVLIAAVFLGITGASILIANRWYGEPLYVQFFFAIVLGGWLLKIIVFFLVIVVLRDQPWIQPTVFFVSIIAGVLVSLIVDAVTIGTMRLPHVSDSSLPTEVPEDAAPGASPSEDGPARS